MGNLIFQILIIIVDAVDDVEAKVSIIVKAAEAGVPVISSMGTGNKMDPSAFRIADIWDTRICPLARAMQQRTETIRRRACQDRVLGRGS